MARTFPGALVPAVNPDGSIQWQNWQYGELLAHLLNDLQIDPSVDLQPPGLVSAQGLPWKLDIGTVAVPWPGGTTTSSVATVAHQLGRIPRLVIGGDFTGSPSFIGSPEISGITSTQFNVQLGTTGGLPAAGSHTTVGWVAIG